MGRPAERRSDEHMTRSGSRAAPYSENDRCCNSIIPVSK
jgi:hypothetical protein